MKHFFVLALSMLMSTSAWSAQFRTGREIQISGQVSEVLFASGGMVRGELKSNHSVFLAGGQVRLKQTTAERLWLAAGTLVLSQSQAKLAVLTGANLDLDSSRLGETLVFGGNISLNASQVQGDWIAAGGDIRADETSRVSGESVIAAGQLSLAGHFDGRVRAWASDAVLKGQFAGDVDVSAEELTVDSGAVIRGDFRYSAKHVEIRPGAKILGQRIEVPRAEPARTAAFGVFGIVAGIFLLVGMAIAPMIVFRLMPQTLMRVGEELQRAPWASLGKGLAFAVLGATAWIITLFSVVGTPVALIAIPVFAAIKIIAAVAILYRAGEWCLRYVSRRKAGAASKSDPRHGMWAVAVGLIVALFVSMIPFLGRAVLMLAFFAGLGATIAVILEYRRRGRLS